MFYWALAFFFYFIYLSDPIFIFLQIALRRGVFACFWFGGNGGESIARATSTTNYSMLPLEACCLTFTDPEAGRSFLFFVIFLEFGLYENFTTLDTKNRLP